MSCDDNFQQQVWEIVEKAQGRVAGHIRAMLRQPPYDQAMFTVLDRDRRITAMQKVASMISTEELDAPAVEREERARKRHEQWSAQHLAAGWQYGEKFDPEAKTHPNLVPWDDLALEDKHKADIFEVLACAARDIIALYTESKGCCRK